MISVPAAYVTSMLNAVRVKDTEVSRAEVEDLIQAACIDIQRQGVKVLDIDEALTKHAIKLYVKANYGYDNEERYRTAYEALSAAMSLSGDYEAGDTDG